MNPTQKNNRLQETVAFLIKDTSFQDLLKETIVEALTSPSLNEARKQKVQEKLTHAEEKLQQAVESKVTQEVSSAVSVPEEPQEDIMQKSLDDLDEIDLEAVERLEKKGVRIIYPNLKYRKPKYNKVGEMMKYVESENGAGEGVKLVIMNFND